MLRYAITDRTLFPGVESERLDALIRHCSLLAEQGIDYIQLREKDLSAADQLRLARGILAAIRTPASHCRLLVNSRADIAVAGDAHGVHLTAATGAIAPGLTAPQVRTLYRAAGLARPVISASCHTLSEVEAAAHDGVDLLLFGPVFAKVVHGREVAPGLGLQALREAAAAAATVPVLALGGVTHRNQASCIEHGAAGVAAIRLFGPGQSSPA